MQTNYSGQNHAFTGSMAINPESRSENVDFGASKTKSRYAFRIVIKMFLGKPGYAKHVFDKFEASKRIC